MTNEELAALMNDPTFRGRIKVCCIKYADSIIAANSLVIGHVSLEKWADSVYAQPEAVAMQIQPRVVMDPAVQAAGAAVLDPALQGAVEAVVNKGI